MAHWCLHRPPGSSSLQGGGSDAGGGSGTGGAGGEASVGEALRRRDEGLMKWFEARVVGLVKQQQGQTGAQGQQQQGEEAARLIALVREVRELAGAGCCSLGSKLGSKLLCLTASFFVANMKHICVCMCVFVCEGERESQWCTSDCRGHPASPRCTFTGVWLEAGRVAAAGLPGSRQRPQ